MLYKKVLLFFAVFLLLFLPVFGQTSAEIESLLGEAEVSCEQAAYFTLAVALDQPPAASQAAFALAREKGWLPANAENGSPITFSGLSFLMMKAFDINGGIMYELTGSRRYAYREMKSRGFITGRAYSNLAVSGEQFLQILGNVADEDGGAW